jgi:hypothetical protein
MKLNFNNAQSVKFEITKITQSPNYYWDSLNNIQGDLFKSKGVRFETIVLQSLNYFFLNCVNTSLLNDCDWSLSFAKSLLDKNNPTGYTPILTNPDSTNLEVYEREFYKECFAIIQFAYYLNEIDLEGNQFFTYLKHFLNTGTKLPESEYKLDLEYLNKKYAFYFEQKTKPEKIIDYWFNGCLFIILNDLGLSVSNFKIVSKEGRQYNPIVKVPRDFRKYFPFVLNQYDIKSAYPHFIDLIIDSNVAGSIYGDIQKRLSIARGDAKILFNKTINSGKYYSREHFTNFFEPYYKAHTSALVDLILDKKIPFWKRMQHWEAGAIENFKKSNRVENVTRLHDAILVIDNSFLPEIRTDFVFYQFERQSLNQVPDTIDFKISNKKPKFNYVGAIPSKLNGIRTENDSKGGVRFQSKGFDIYETPFNYIKAGFNISYKGHASKLGWVPFTENDFKNKCVNCALVIRDLNPEKDSIALSYIFKQIVSHIAQNGAYSFNEQSVFNLMIDSIGDAGASPKVKTKNWYFKGNADFNNLDFYDFTKLLNEARAKAKLYFITHQIFPLVEQSYKEKKKIYIDLNRFGLSDKRDCELVFDLVHSFNKANGFDSLVFANTLNDFIGLYTQSVTTYKKPLYTLTESVYKASENALAKQYGIHRQTAKRIKNWFTTPQDKTQLGEVYYTLHAILNNYKDLEHEIIKTENNRLSIVKVQEVQTKTQLPQLTPEQAFFVTETETNIEQISATQYVVNVKTTVNKAPDLKGSVLECDLETAINRGDDFIFSWFLFNNKDLTACERFAHQRDRFKTIQYVKHSYYYPQMVAV